MNDTGMRGFGVGDQAGFHPADLRDRATRRDLRGSPSIIETRPDAPHPKRRSWEKDAVVIGGGAGDGISLIHDFAARHK